MSKITSKIQSKFAKKDPRKAKQIGVGDNLRQLTDKDFITLPKDFQDAWNMPGLPFGRITTIAGREDSGKSSCAIICMRAAIEQGCGVIYVETENKTNTQDLIDWGVDPSQVIIVKSTIAEEAFEMLFEAWDAFKEKYPDAPILVIFDSIGNVVSLRDSELDLTSDSSQPGGKGKINRLALSKMVAKRDEDNAAILLVSYTYSNIGSVGRTTAGGDALKLLSSLMYQTARKGWHEKTVNGQKVRVGAKVIWTLQKNHVFKNNPGPKQIEFLIDKDGMHYLNNTSEETEEE